MAPPVTALSPEATPRSRARYTGSAVPSGLVKPRLATVPPDVTVIRSPRSWRRRRGGGSRRQGGQRRRETPGAA